MKEANPNYLFHQKFFQKQISKFNENIFTE